MSRRLAALLSETLCKIVWARDLQRASSIFFTWGVCGWVAVASNGIVPHKGVFAAIQVGSSFNEAMLQLDIAIGPF